MEIALTLFVCSLVAYVIKGTTGFGDAIVFISTAGLFYDLTWIVPLALLLAFLNNSYMAFRLESWSLLLKRKTLLGGMIGGIIAGTILFAGLSNEALRYCIAGIVTLVALHEIAGETADEDRPVYEQVDGGVGLFAGLSGGLFGMAGPPLVGYVRLHHQRFDFRRLIVPFFAVITGIACAMHVYNGVYWTIPLPVFGGVGTGLVAGTLIGMPLLQFINERLFSVVIALFLIAASIGLVAQLKASAIDPDQSTAQDAGYPP